MQEPNTRKQVKASQDIKQETEAIWQYVTSVKNIKKRDGQEENFHVEKMEASIKRAYHDAGIDEPATANQTTEHVLARLHKRFNGHTTPTADEVREAIALTLIDENSAHVARKYLLHRSEQHRETLKPIFGHGISIKRVFSKEGIHPYDELEWEIRDASITNEKGKIVFEQKGVELPKTYSQTATNIIVSKYFRGRLGESEREWSMRQLVDRVAKTISYWGRTGGYFATEEDALIFEYELTSILVNQRAAFNSPVWFNVGVNPNPQCSACFINSVQDDMRSILNLAVTEGMLFKYGSGSGVNLSTLRSSREKLAQSSGKSSGPVSFMKGLDAFAGVIKSGGKTRRAAKMVVLNVDHPDILDFIWCKAKEEKKAHALVDVGYDSSLDGEAYGSIFFQNANNSVRVTDTFMKAVENDEEWTTIAITNKTQCDRYRAREVMRQIAQAAWECGDPGIQYDTTINHWNTCANSDRIHASNPCSEYMFLNDTACNLSSINLMRCRKQDGSFDMQAFEQCSRIMITAQEIIVGYSSYPTPAIEQNSYDFRSLGIGYANLGSLIMAMGLPYDSDDSRAVAGAITSLMTAIAYEQSAIIASKIGPFAMYQKNREPMLGVIRRHREKTIKTFLKETESIQKEAVAIWDHALALGEQFGFRNSQISLLAPTGTISFLMDCATTGIEPEIALVKYKWLVGGGMLKIVNDTVTEALQRLEYSNSQIKDILSFIDQNDTIENAPHIKDEHIAVFDCAFKAAKGKRSIHYRGHLRMMAAVQPYLSGAISKTVNMPETATVDEVINVYMEGWKLGLKAIAIYRDGCKRVQPLTTSKNSTKETANQAPRRRRLSDERRAITHKFQIGTHEGYITVGLYDSGEPGEIFITMSKQGSVIRGLMDAFATSVSIGLQYGVPLRVLVNKFAHMRFEPSGFTPNPNIRLAKSIVDYIFRWLALKFLPPEDRHAVGINIEGPTTPLVSDIDLLTSNNHVNDSITTTVDQPKLIDLNIKLSQAGKLSSTFENQTDAPPCHTCGSIMVRNATCYKCLNCGATTGCS